MFNCGRNQIEKACEYKFKIYVLDRISVALLNALLVARSCLTPCDPMNCQASLPTEFSRQEYWSGSPFPSPGDLPWPGYRTWISWIAGRFFNIWARRLPNEQRESWKMVPQYIKVVILRLHMLGHRILNETIEHGELQSLTPEVNYLDLNLSPAT